jgi:UDP-N-acetyl-2-amino-2-deoxyglucuronate dehydrogenase
MAGAAAPIRFGIIGCGKIAVNHVVALRQIPGVEVRAVADLDGMRAQSFARRFGVPTACTDTDQMWAAGLDAVAVCTPHAAHEAGVVAAARNGVHVLCEKPMATSLDQAQRMIEATTRAGVRFGVVFQRRFWPAAVRIRHAIDDGSLGPPIAGGAVVRFKRDRDYYAEAWRGTAAAEGGGVLMTQAIHHVDLLQWFMGRAVRVTGRVANLAHDGLIDVEDIASAIIEFASGGLATVAAGTTFDPGLGAQVWVSGANGRTAGLTEFPEGIGFTDLWSLPGEEEYATGYRRGEPFDIPLSEIHRNLVPVHTQQIEDFVAAIREDRDPAVTGREAVKSLEIVQAIYSSSKLGGPVDLTM